MTKNISKIQPNIRKLNSGKEHQKYGVYNDLIQVTNTNAWDGTKGWKSPRRWQRKSWIFFGAYSAEISVGFAIVDAGFLGKAFCYIYHPKTGKILPVKVPLNLGEYGRETYVGGMDEVFLYNRALSADEVKATMKSFSSSVTAVDSRDKLATCWASLKK